MFIVSLAKFCATLLMIGDMVTDTIATYSRFLRCSSGEISCVFFWSTLIVLLISWILAIVLAVQKRNIIGAEMFWTLIFYPFTLPVYSMALTCTVEYRTRRDSRGATCRLCRKSASSSSSERQSATPSLAQHCNRVQSGPAWCYTTSARWAW